MRRLPFLIFILLMATAAVSSYDSVRRTERRIAQDVDRALAMTMEQRPDFRLDADTLAVYRSNISIAEVRDTACLTMLVAQEKSGPKAVIKAESGCSLATTFMLSDQRASGWLAALAVVWLLGSSFIRTDEKLDNLDSLDNLENVERIERVERIAPLHLTPMQRQLVTLLQNAPNNCVPKREICQALWGNKDNAEESLYTLVRRTKKVLADSNMEIVCNRGESYQLQFS